MLDNGAVVIHDAVIVVSVKGLQYSDFPFQDFGVDLILGNEFNGDESAVGNAKSFVDGSELSTPKNHGPVNFDILVQINKFFFHVSPMI